MPPPLSPVAERGQFDHGGRGMKPRIMLLVILAIVAAGEILVTVAFGLNGGTGKTMLGATLLAAASAVPLYFVAVRPLARSREKLRDLSRRAEVQDILITIDAMAMEAEEPERILRKAAEDVRRLLNVTRCTIWLFETPDVVVEHCAAGLPPAATDFPLRKYPEKWKELCRSRKCTVVADVKKSAASRPVVEAMERFGATSFIKAPLCLPEGPIGFLFVCRPEPHAWSDDAILVARAVARQVGTAVGHARKVRRREDVTESLLSLLDHVPGLVYRGQRDWSMTIVSADVERMTGYSPNEFLDGTVNWKHLIHPDDLPSLKMTFRNAVARGHRVLRVEYRTRHKNGNYRWFADRRQIVYDEKGHFLHADGICVDITERKRIESEKAAQMMSAEIHAVS